MRFPGQEIWSGLPFPSQGIFLSQGLNLCILCKRHFLHCRQILYPWATWEAASNINSGFYHHNACYFSLFISKMETIISRAAVRTKIGKEHVNWHRQDSSPSDSPPLLEVASKLSITSPLHSSAVVSHLHPPSLQISLDTSVSQFAPCRVVHKDPLPDLELY